MPTNEKTDGCSNDKYDRASILINCQHHSRERKDNHSNTDSSQDWILDRIQYSLTNTCVVRNICRASLAPSLHCPLHQRAASIATIPKMKTIGVVMVPTKQRMQNRLHQRVATCLVLEYRLLPQTFAPLACDHRG